MVQFIFKRYVLVNCTVCQEMVFHTNFPFSFLCFWWNWLFFCNKINKFNAPYTNLMEETELLAHQIKCFTLWTCWLHTSGCYAVKAYFWLLLSKNSGIARGKGRHMPRATPLGGAELTTTGKIWTKNLPLLCNVMCRKVVLKWVLCARKWCFVGKGCCSVLWKSILKMTVHSGQSFFFE